MLLISQVLTQTMRGKRKLRPLARTRSEEGEEGKKYISILVVRGVGGSVGIWVARQVGR